MDYLKYLLVAILTLAAVAVLGPRVGGHIGLFGPVFAGYYFLRRSASPASAVAFVLFLLLFFWWTIYIESEWKILAAQNPQLYPEDKRHLFTGMMTLIGLVVFHPACYGLGKLSVFFWNKFRPTKEAA